MKKTKMLALGTFFALAIALFASCGKKTDYLVLVNKEHPIDENFAKKEKYPFQSSKKTLALEMGTSDN